VGGFIFRWRRPIIILLVVMVVSVSLSFTAKIRGRVVALSSLVNTLVSPASSSLGYLGQKTAAGIQSLDHLFRLEAENRALTRQLEQYRSLQLELDQLAAQNSRLRGLLGLKAQAQGWNLLAATIIARNPDSWFDTVEIDRGRNQGVTPGMAVIVPQGVVGRVIAASASTATVMLIVDPDSAVGAIDVRSQAAGVLLGHESAQGTLTFQLFSHHPDVMPGDVVVTSGYSQYYPRGLLLGQVVSVAPANYGLTEVAQVAPAVHFDRLQTVLVVRAHPRGASFPPVFPGGA
jgi:rod shape-determining protein MreC